MAIDIDSILILILGSSAVASVITLAGTYFIEQKQREKDRANEISDRMLSEVYSPILFYLFKVAGYLSNNRGNLMPLKEDDGSKQAMQIQTERLKKDSELYCSDSIEKILLNKIGFIKPKTFRTDFFLYLQLLEDYEKQMKDFANEGFDEDTIEAEKKWLLNMLLAANELTFLNTQFTFFVNKLINQKSNKKDPQYISLFSGHEANKERFAVAIKLIRSRNELKLNELESKLKNIQA